MPCDLSSFAVLTFRNSLGIGQPPLNREDNHARATEMNKFSDQKAHKIMRHLFQLRQQKYLHFNL